MTLVPTGQQDNCQKNKDKEKSLTEAGTAMKEFNEGEYAALPKSKGTAE
jgi:hypothetical protein